MKITIVSRKDISGGAAKAAYRLFKGLETARHQVHMVVLNKSSMEAAVIPVVRTDDDFIDEHISKAIRQELINNNRTALSNSLFTYPIHGYDIRNIPAIANADIINLHWVGTFQSVETISWLSNMAKPVVWTLHDQNPFTGGCHYTAGCSNYTNGCIDCPQLEQNSDQLPAKVLQNKKRLWGDANISLITPSNWLAGCVRQSSLFKNSICQVIVNGIDTTVYCPVSKNDAKRKLGIKPDTVVVLFGAGNHKEKRKGLDQLIQAMRLFAASELGRKIIIQKKICISLFGHPVKELFTLGIKVHNFGFVNDEKKIATIYNAANITVVPSLEDNLPNMLLESMACATPVIGFNTGGIPDLVNNGETGFIAEQYNEKQLADSIMQLVTDQELCIALGYNCRNLVENHYTIVHQAQQYVSFFEKLMGISRKNNLAINTCLNSKLHISPIFFDLYRSVTRKMLKNMGIMKKEKIKKKAIRMLIPVNIKKRFRTSLNRIKL